ncbi:MAG: hypothetical protein WCJ35_03255 [Planctomycetota bacterium]
MVRLVLLVFAVLGAEDRIATKFSDVDLDPPFDKYLRASVALMGASGPKILKLADGKKVVIVVESVVLEDKSPKSILDGEKVCRLKALRDLVAGTQGVQIFSLQKSEDQTVNVRTEQGEKYKSVSQYMEITEIKLRTVARDLPVVGRWKSKDGLQLYLAIGAVLDKDGDPIAVPLPEEK